MRQYARSKRNHFACYCSWRCVSDSWGIIATYATQLFNNRTERKKFVREKCEEVYLLADQVIIWVENENDAWWQSYLKQYEPDNEYLQIERKIVKQLDCPIDKLMMIVALHLPELKAKSKALRKVVDTYQEYSNYFPEQGWDIFSGDVKAVLRYQQHSLETAHHELRLLIEKTALHTWGLRMEGTKLRGRLRLLIKNTTQNLLKISKKESSDNIAEKDIIEANF